MRHDKNRGSSRPLAAFLTVMAGIVLATAACGGGGTSAASGASASASATSLYARQLAYSQCVRSHGVPKFPDPDSNGHLNVNTSDLGVSTSVLQAADQACSKFKPVPPGGGQAGQNPAQNAARALKWAKCLRKHGIPNFPDPGSNGSFNVPSSISTQSPTFKAAENACKSAVPGQLSMGSGGAS